MSRRGKLKVHHRKTFMNGTATPDEVHRALALKQPCHFCGGPPAIKIKTLITYDDLWLINPQLCLIMAKANNGQVPVVPTTYGNMVKMSSITACDNCKVAAERAAAHPPRPLKDKVLIEIDRGPGKTVAVAVPRNYVKA